MTTFLIGLLLASAPMVLFLLVCVAIEFAAPRERYPLRSRFPTALWLVAQPALITLAAYPIKMVWQHLGVAPLIDLTSLGFWGGFVAMMLIFDGLRYFEHRLEHKFWWPFHAVHHSIRKLHAANSYAHPFEGVAEAICVIIPLSLIQSSPNVLLLVGAISGFQNVIIHSPIRADMGPLRTIFVEGPFHRIHHSVEREHHDKNFGFVFSFWDRLFGTAHEPQPDEWPATGIEDLPPPRTFVGFLLHPLQHFGSMRRFGRHPAEPEYP